MLWVLGLIYILFCGATSDCYVAADECPPNEEYLTCGSACPLNCTNQYDEPVACTANCVAGCFCKPGFLRNEYGACVPVEECFDECPPNEEYLTCGSECPLNCTNQYDEPVACTANCVEGCFCKPGFLRNEYGACVPVEECFDECPPNEEYLTCGSACPLNCTNQYNEPVACTANCVEGCFCKPGFLRNEYGACVPVEECFVCSENEEYKSCGSACPPTCSRPEPGVCSLVCRKGCFCKSGYYRDESTNKCVKRDQCPKNECSTNEEYLTCGSACPLNCTNQQQPVACTDNCVQGCFCKPDFLRNKTGACVPVEKCFDECPPNEEYLTCGSACPLNCTNQYDEPVACTANCVEGCFCKPGFLKNEYGACVPVEECFDECPPNEEYLTCGSACPLNCTNQYDEPVACTANCVEGCFCKPGFLKNEYGACVPVEECFDECSPNEEYLTCGSACPLNCTNQYDEPVACTANCVEGCFCKPGFLRNDYGACVPVEECFDECPPNEEYLTCGSACPLNCTNQYDEPVACTANCVEGCFCKPGFLRNEYGACVPVEECFDECPPNEEYLTCGSACPLNCTNQYDEPVVCTANCVEGCFCKPGFLRNEYGACVPVEECFDRCPDNEVYDKCKAGCQPSCNKKASPFCSRICFAGCVCSPGLLRNDDGDCVSVDECFENQSYISFLYNYLNDIYRILFLSYYA